MDDTTRQIVFGLAAPMVIAGLFTWPSVTNQPPEGRRPGRSWLRVLAVALPVVVAFLGLHGWPEEKWQSMTWIPLAGAAVGIVIAMTPRHAWNRGLAFMLLAGICTWCIWPVIEGESLFVKVIPGVAVLGVAASLETLSTRRPGPVMLLAMTMTTGAAAAVVLISGFMGLSIPTGAGCVALVTVGLVAIVRRRALSLADGPVAVIAPLLVLAPLVAWLYGVGEPLPAWCFAIPAGAALLLWIDEIPLLRPLVLAAAPCVLAIVVALNPPPAPVEEDDPDESGENQSWEDMYMQELEG